MSIPNRNDPCPCGSGKKYKQCCLKNDGPFEASKQAETASIPDIIQIALEHHQAGRLSQAESIYQQILQIDPNHPDALHFSGVIAQQTGRNELAAELIGMAICVNPSNPMCYINLGNTLKSLDRLDEAGNHYLKVLSLQPDYAEAYFNLGLVQMAQDMPDAAVESYHQAIFIRSNYAEAHSNLGAIFKDQGKFDEAIQHFRHALILQPSYANVHNNLGTALKAQGKLDAAIESFQKALSLQPNYSEAHYNLGNALQEQGKQGAAVESFQKALSLKPNYAEAHYNLGNALREQGKLDEAIEHYHKALSLKTDYAEAHSNLGFALQEQGRPNEAIGHYHKALSIKPGMADTHSNLMFTLNYHPDMSEEDVYRAAQEYETLRGIPLRQVWPVHCNNKTPNRRLRVGYVSPDFRNHAIAYFAEPILANHDKSQIEIFCYAEVKKEDKVTGRFRQLADHWHSTVGMSDEAVAKMIGDHQIDILVDLAGHTAKNRLLVFARKPAPIQITYLGYLGTTGLSAMDYLITDHHANPESLADAYYSESLLRMPDSLWCFRPSTDVSKVSPLPALTRGYLTFGSFNRFNKIDQPTLELWAALLQALPTSRLIMLAVPEGEARHRLLHRFTEMGVNAERLELHGKLPIAGYRSKFLEVDLALDPITGSGATTTCETLWMGVPVISLVGTRFSNRAGLSILSTTGMADFATTSPEDYIRIAIHLADNLPLLAEIRAGLRSHLSISPLLDEIGFTRNLESLYRQIWGKWCGA